MTDENLEIIIANLKRIREDLGMIEQMIDKMLPDEKKIRTHSIVDQECGRRATNDT